MGFFEDFLGIYIPGDWGFSKIWGFLFRGFGIFIPEIYIPGIGDLYTGDRGFSIPGMFLRCRICFRGMR